MKNKLTLMVLLLIIIIPINIYSQDKETGIITKVKYKEKSEYFYVPKVGVSLSINNPIFYSEGFTHVLENELLIERNKMIFGGNMSFGSVLVDFNYIYNGYRSSIQDFTYTGYEGFISYRTSIINYYNLDPYIGVGYQFSQIAGSESVLDISQPIWKIGFRPFIPLFNNSNDNNIVYIILEYKQSFNTSNPHAFNSFSYGLGYGWIFD